jgi:uncharacterized protein (DUF302 family)
MAEGHPPIADGTTPRKVAIDIKERAAMSNEQPPAIIEHRSAYSFDTTLERLAAAINQAGLLLFNRIDHHVGAREAGLDMPPTTVLTYGHPKGGTPIMLAAPLAALDLPLRVLVRVRDDGNTAIAFHPIAGVLRRACVPDALTAKLDPAQQILVNAVAG